MQYYTLTNQCHLFLPTGHSVISDIDDLERMKPEIPTWNYHDLAKEFKNEKSTIKKLIKDRKDQLGLLVDKESLIKNWCYKNSSSKPLTIKSAWGDFEVTLSQSEWEEIDLMFRFVDAPRVHLLEDIKRLERTLFYMQDNKDGKIDVEKARQRPITDFLEFNGFGFAKSIWNNSDKTPSMKFYRKENRVHCFSTGEDEDVIGVVMKIKGCSFIEAVKFILN